MQSMCLARGDNELLRVPASGRPCCFVPEKWKETPRNGYKNTLGCSSAMIGNKADVVSIKSHEFSGSGRGMVKNPIKT